MIQEQPNISDSNNRIKKILISILFCSWAIHLALIWLYRFVPSVDYPEWLLQANILSHYNTPSYGYIQWYRYVFAPIPNGGFVLPTAFLAIFFPIEIAGKLMVSLYIILFPLATRYFCHSIGDRSPWWLISILFLFNISFTNGNLAFLIAVCVLLWTLGFAERTISASSPHRRLKSLLLTLILFLSHALCGMLFLLYIVIRLSEKKSGREHRRQLITSAVIISCLGLFYYFMKPFEPSYVHFVWGFDPRYRLSALLKSFVAGISFPPYSFSLLRTLSNGCMFLFVAFLGFLSLHTVKQRYSSSAIPKLILLILLAALCSPKAIVGIGEPTQRFAFIGFILLTGFFVLTERLQRVGLSAIIFLSIIVTTVRVQDYVSTSSMLQRRFTFLDTFLSPHPNILTLNDDLGTSKVPFYYIIPKGVSFIFQTNYHLLSGGYNPLSFRTGYVIPRDDFFFRLDQFINERTTKGLLALRGMDIPLEINYIVIDTGTDWGAQMIEQLKPTFDIVAETKITKGLNTILLERHESILNDHIDHLAYQQIGRYIH